MIPGPILYITFALCHVRTSVLLAFEFHIMKSLQYCLFVDIQHYFNIMLSFLIMGSSLLVFYVMYYTFLKIMKVFSCIVLIIIVPYSFYHNHIPIFILAP